MRNILKKYSVLLCFVLLLSGCDMINKQIYGDITETPDTNMEDNGGEAAEQEVDEDISGNLDICTYDTSYYTMANSWFTKEFNKKYPNVFITFKLPEEGITIEEYSTKATAALMSGTAGDIIDLFCLPYYAYAQNDLLVDLYPIMDNDPSFRREDYYTNIFDALEFNEELYGVPLGFNYWCYRFNRELLDQYNIDVSQYDTVNYKDIFEIYQQIFFMKKDLLITKGWNNTMFDQDEVISYVSEKYKTVNFNSKEFVEYLDTINSIKWSPNDKEIVTDDYLLDLGDNELCGFFRSDYTRAMNAKVFNGDSLKMTAPIPDSASNGDKPFQVFNFMGITSSSRKKDLAWLFLRFMMEEKNKEKVNKEVGENYTIGYYINRNNTLKALENVFGPGHEEDIAKIDLWNSERNCMNLNEYKLMLAIYDIETDFITGNIKAEECADQMQKQVDIIFDDQLMSYSE